MGAINSMLPPPFTGVSMSSASLTDNKGPISRRRDCTSVAQGRSGLKKFLVAIGKAHTQRAKASHRSCRCWCLQDTAAVDIISRQISTNLPKAARESQKRTAARPRRNTNKNDTGVNNGDIRPFSEVMNTDTVPDSSSSNANAQQMSQSNKQNNGAQIIPKFRPFKPNIMRNENGSYDIILASQSSRASRRGLYSIATNVGNFLSLGLSCASLSSVGSTPP
mmetsp:Transcript_4277/g.6505  ORF Transcript_4277/g.6505 Transcript_4277/m.6505 type:complete len:221 (+) Transcript_4277:832-1494(+)